jgi:hypothetical protein
MQVLHGTYEKGNLQFDQEILPAQKAEAEVILLNRKNNVKAGWKRVLRKIEIKRPEYANRVLEEERREI